MLTKPNFQAVWRGLWRAATRRRTVSNEPSKLARLLTLFDLVLLGVGSTLGLGLYVLAGKVANEMAGPAALLSFIVAAIASLFAGFAFAEFGARVPRAGSAYLYAYVATGEIVAFVNGWSLILEYAIGAASVTRGVSTYVDNLLDHRMTNFFNSTMPMNVPTLAPYPDFFSFSIIILITALLAFGVKESSIVNNILTIVNLTTASVAIVAAALYANTANWSLPPRPGVDAGGFFPYGVAGIVKGAGTCFFGFIGFDCVAMTSEEAKRPKRDIPLAIILSVLIICATYCGITVTLTLMKPYFVLDTEAPLTNAFLDLNLGAVVWIVTMGAIFALAASLLGAMFPLPRIMYAMALDGLLFPRLAKVNNYTKTPLVATLVSGGLAGILALAFDLDQLVEMLSIGTLVSYTIVVFCVLVLRYTEAPSAAPGKAKPLTLRQWLAGLVNWEGVASPTSLSCSVATVLIFAQLFLSLALSLLLSAADNDLYVNPSPWLGSLVPTLVLLVVVVVLLGRQPKSDVSHLSFSVPGVPYVPALSLFLDLYLMVNLAPETWVRLIVWMLIGTVVYFTYSLKHSKERLRLIAEKKRDLDEIREQQ